MEIVECCKWCPSPKLRTLKAKAESITRARLYPPSPRRGSGSAPVDHFRGSREWSRLTGGVREEQPTAGMGDHGGKRERRRKCIMPN